MATCCDDRWREWDQGYTVQGHHPSCSQIRPTTTVVLPELRGHGMDESMSDPLNEPWHIESDDNDKYVIVRASGQRWPDKISLMTRALAERVVSDHNAALAAREPAGGEAQALREAIRSALEDFEHRDEIGAVDGLRVALLQSAPERPACCEAWAYDPVGHGPIPVTEDGHHPTCPNAVAAHPARDDGAGE
jgi:hypothetical protein